MQKSKAKKEKKPKPKYNMWQNSAFMISLAWNEKEKKVLVLSFLSAAFAVAISLIQLYITPTILSAVENQLPLGEIALLILIFVGLLMLFYALSSYINFNTLYGRIQVRSAIISALNRKAATTSYSNISNEKFRNLCVKSGEATCSNSQATEAVWTTLTNLTKNILGFIIYIILLFSLDLWMLLVIIATTLIGYFISKRLDEYGYRHREELAEHENKLQYIDEKSGDHATAKDIRIFGIKPWLEELGSKSMEAFTAFHKKANGVYIWGRIVDLVLTFARNGIAYAYLLHMVLNNGLNASEFLLYFTAVSGFTTWISGILESLSTLNRQSLDISTIRECIEYPEPYNLDSGEALIPDNTAKYEIKLENVSFRYPESDKNTLENINLTLRPGEKLAIVGLNGAGKTTLVKVICGFYNPTEGKVLLNGKDIREYNRRDYYKLFSAVFQDFCLLAETVATNVAQTKDDIDMDKVKKCVEQAGLLAKIQALPNGFDSYLNKNIYTDATMLSGGEAQRLMLARALYKDSPVIVLDEPTAALDPIAEAHLYQKYSEMTLGKSSIYISHRLASTRFCDRIILIEKNRITEEGSHDQLLALGGRYAELFEVQSKYYTEEAEENEEKE